MERDDLTMLVARNIEAIIARKGLTAAEVNRRANLGQTGVNDILHGKSRNPRIDTIHKIAVMGLKVPVSALFSEPRGEMLDQELLETFGMMTLAERERFLNMARAYLGNGPEESDELDEEGPASDPQ
ncbi:helix-turn-helix transcriptional regulator [Paracoccus sp. AS002]|uniref:helix-turn-helix domain-containing protein n=1 Tax=Paracoccus sp. AS002 TaxID=3019545 RepID=UPI0023E8305E|nr:helix-turn-helix transcriptional regulator [Paracoccus sp. AS002]MDF3904669.1 helix-turn-helix transcriptional regulator [Paracoccus sp. AS002]